MFVVKVDKVLAISLGVFLKVNPEIVSQLSNRENRSIYNTNMENIDQCKLHVATGSNYSFASRVDDRKYMDID
jgi:hypothetical protein